jgi:hypothetical protein
MSERYPTKEALDAAGTGAQDATHQTFGKLDELLAGLSARRLLSRGHAVVDSNGWFLRPFPTSMQKKPRGKPRGLDDRSDVGDQNFTVTRPQ